MTVEELIKELKRYPDNAKVVMYDYMGNGNIDRIEPYSKEKIIIIAKEELGT